MKIELKNLQITTDEINGRFGATDGSNFYFQFPSIDMLRDSLNHMFTVATEEGHFALRYRITKEMGLYAEFLGLNYAANQEFK